MWIEDDEFGVTWRVAAGWAELLIERAHPARGPRERAARDTAGLLVYQGAVLHRCRPGLVQLSTVQQLLTTDALAAALREALTDSRHQYAAGHLRVGVDLAAGIDLLEPIVTQALRDHPGATPLEDLWPAGTLLSRGGGGPTW
jgi:hypothetical protein